MILINWLRTLRIRWVFANMEKSKKTRTELRQQVCIVEGKRMRVLEYIDKIAPDLVNIQRNGSVIDHRRIMREHYYAYDFKGLLIYVKIMNRVIKREKKKIARKIKAPSSKSQNSNSK